MMNYLTTSTEHVHLDKLIVALISREALHFIETEFSVMTGLRVIHWHHKHCYIIRKRLLVYPSNALS
jgi:hypothetical protein